jgi:hypothetical protein
MPRGDGGSVSRIVWANMGGLIEREGVMVRTKSWWARMAGKELHTIQEEEPLLGKQYTGYFLEKKELRSRLYRVMLFSKESF